MEELMVHSEVTLMAVRKQVAAAAAAGRDGFCLIAQLSGYGWTCWSVVALVGVGEMLQ